MDDPVTAIAAAQIVSVLRKADLSWNKIIDVVAFDGYAGNEAERIQQLKDFISPHYQEKGNTI